MISDSHTRYGSQLSRHGKSRACRSYQASRRVRNVLLAESENVWIVLDDIKIDSADTQTTRVSAYASPNSTNGFRTRTVP